MIARPRHGLLGLDISEVSDVIAAHVPNEAYVAVQNAAVGALGDFEEKVNVFFRGLAPHAVRAVLRAREERIRARAIAANAAARYRYRAARVHRPASARARRTRTVRSATRAGPSDDSDGEPPRAARACGGRDRHDLAFRASGDRS